MLLACSLKAKRTLSEIFLKNVIVIAPDAESCAVGVSIFKSNKFTMMKIVFCCFKKGLKAFFLEVIELTKRFSMKRYYIN